MVRGVFGEQISALYRSDQVFLHIDRLAIQKYLFEGLTTMLISMMYMFFTLLNIIKVRLHLGYLMKPYIHIQYSIVQLSNKYSGMLGKFSKKV